MEGHRAAAVVVSSLGIAFIERQRGNAHYFVAPGGGVEHGETVEGAAAREALEELGLEVQLGHKILELHEVARGRSVQHYFLATIDTTDFGPMTGPEQASPGSSYIRRWVHLAEIAELNVLPAALKSVLCRAADHGWPTEPVITRSAVSLARRDESRPGPSS